MKLLRSILRQLSLLTIIVCLLAMGSIGKVFAYDYTVALTTYTVDAGTNNFVLGGYPNIADGAKIDQIVFSNAGDVDQLVQIYDLADSSLTAVVAFQIVVPSTATSHAVPVTINWPWINRLKVRNMGAKKLDTGSTVYMNVNYN